MKKIETIIEGLRRDPFISQRGNGLLSVLVGMAIIGILTLVLTQSLTSLNKRSAKINQMNDRNLIKKMLLQNVQCTSLPQCKGTESISIKDKFGAEIVSYKGDTKIGVFTIRAQCVSSGSLEIRMAALDKNGRFKRDPLTAEELSWSKSDNLLFKEGEFCKAPESDQKSKITVIQGDYCSWERGTCEGPNINASPRMCCVDGRDSKKPICPDGKSEIGAVWDRQGDWGVNGSWSVLCQ